MIACMVDLDAGPVEGLRVKQPRKIVVMARCRGKGKFFNRHEAFQNVDALTR